MSTPVEPMPHTAFDDEFSFADHLPVLCWIAHADGHIFWYNRRWYEYTGTSPQSQQGWGWESVHDPNILPLVLERWGHSIATGAPFEMTFPLKGADGQFRQFLTRIVPRYDAHGKIRGWYGTNVDISAQVSAEHALRSSEARFRLFAEAMPNHVWTSRPTGDLDWFNSTVYKYSGYPEGALDGTGWTRLVHPDDLAIASRNWSSALESGKSYETEFRLRRQDGVYRWFIARATPILNDGGDVTQWIGTNTDIEEQKSTEQALIDSERRLILAQKAAGIAAFEVDIATDTVVASDEFWELWGLPPRDRVDISVLERLIISDDSKIHSNPQSRAQGTANSIVEYRIRRADTGEMRWLWRAVDFVRDRDGVPQRMFGMLQDITKRKFDEMSLRASEARYRGAMSVGRIGSWETDFVAGKRYWTPEAQALFDISLPNGVGVVGGSDDEFASALHPDDKHLVAHFHELARTVESFDAEYRIVRRDGTLVWLAGRAQVFERDIDGRCKRLINVVADVTESKGAADHVRFLLREMSHRSKNLLAIVQGIARQTARRSVTIDEFQKQFIDRLQGLSASHDLLVEQKWQKVSLSDLVRRQLGPFVSADSQRLEIIGAELSLNARAAQAIGLALHELATNAVKYGALSVATGRVVVSWSDEQQADGGTHVAMRWVELGGPPVTEPSRLGFGKEVMTRIAPQTISGSAEIDYDPNGIEYTLTAPLSALSAVSDETTIDQF